MSMLRIRSGAALAAVFAAAALAGGCTRKAPPPPAGYYTGPMVPKSGPGGGESPDTGTVMPPKVRIPDGGQGPQ